MFTKLIFDAEGCVNSVEVIEGLDAGLDASVSSTHQWGVLTPVSVDGKAVPIGYNTMTTFDVREEH